jgi:hypothetical protein
MIDTTENILKVIQQEDPSFKKRPHLDFQMLRSEGLKHIGELSGKIWTDHNTHDPGITILEVLCYALIDLGYRTQLDFADVIATPSSSANLQDEFLEDDNFFTPLEILTCNPTTITDYRKLILDVKGVRNAWLEPAENQEIPIQEGEINVKLNGLYSILIEKDPDADEEVLNNELCNVLSAHRNLAEDFKEITFLKPFELGICADIEIEKSADATTVYGKVLNTIKSYISPGIRYYTLKELLLKGKPIEEIFAGRPFGLESYGFIDTKELEELPFRTELFASNLYKEILLINGVVAIRNLSFESDQPAKLNANIQRLCIPNGHFAQFDLDRCSIDFRSGQGIIHFDKTSVNKGLLLSNKSKITRNNLDLPIPQGDFQPELGSYLSIQHEFPLVYGIGEGGLPVDSSLQRQAQALQLKGYLLFYDQLLANYLAQISNLRNLFSLQQESKRDSAGRRTYFSQVPKDVPGIARLSQVYATEGLSKGLIMATPIPNNGALNQKLLELSVKPQVELRVEGHCGSEPDALAHFFDDSDVMREIRIQQSIRDITQRDYFIEIHQDKAGYFFVIRFTQFSDLIFLSYTRYRNQVEAREAANFASFLATQQDYYQKNVSENENGIAYQYDLVFNPEAYLYYLHHLLEDEHTYCQRREALLDHLLARFANQFTDYSLLRFGTPTLQKVERKQAIEDKSRFLNHFDDTSRNRGRAFDYLQPSWGTENVSGYEKRIALLTGMSDWTRRSLCKFEVVQSNRVVVPNLEGQPWISSIAIYPSAKEAEIASAAFIAALPHPEEYDDLKNQFSGFDPTTVGRLFSEKPTIENIVELDHQYALLLKPAQGNTLLLSKKQNYPTPAEAWKALPQFLKEISETKNGQIELVEALENTGLYLNNKELHYEVKAQYTYKWVHHNADGSILAEADTSFPDEASALKDFIEKGDLAQLITPIETALQWAVIISNDIPLASTTAYANEISAQLGWSLCRAYGQNEQNYFYEAAPLGAIKIGLRNEKGIVIAEAKIPANQKIGPETYIQACCTSFQDETKELKYRYTDKAYGWNLASIDGESLLTSFELYLDASQAFQSLLDAINAGQSSENYLLLGAKSPGYSIILVNSAGRYLATHSQPYFSTVKERNKALATIQKGMKEVSIPLKIQEVLASFSWKLSLPSSGTVVLKSNQSFDSIGSASADFVNHLRLELDNEQSLVAPHLYSIDTLPQMMGFRYVYNLNTPTGEALPWLLSDQQFEKFEDAKTAYTLMRKALPQLQYKEDGKSASFTDGQNITLRLAEDSPSNREKTKELLEYLRKWSQTSTYETTNGKWIYRLVDKDSPIAKTKAIFGSKAEAKGNLDVACQFKPALLDRKKQVLHVMCPDLDPDRFHYAISLSDDAGNDYVFLVSYLGYENKEQALAAGEANWLRLLDLATVRDNFGPNKFFSPKEEYSTGNNNSCIDTEPFLAVLPSDFVLGIGEEELAIDKAVALAQRYPIRIHYNEAERGRQNASILGYTFQGYDLNVGIVWVSAKTYPSPQAAIEAYHLFVVVLNNPNSCRIVCSEGKYRIHLVEILAESKELASENEAWGERPKPENQQRCEDQGVRLFAAAAGDENAFIHFSEADSYRFMVVDKTYHAANHKCTYANRNSRDQAMDQIMEWAKTLTCEPYRLEKNGSMKFYIGDGYYWEVNLSGTRAIEADIEQIIMACMHAAIDERNIKSTDDSWEITHPFDHTQTLASIKREKAEDAVDKAAFVSLVRQYPVFKRADAYYYRLYFPENHSVLDQELEWCGCDKESNTPAEIPSFCNHAYIFESALSYPTRIEAEAAFLHFCNLLKSSASYQPDADTGLGRYSFSIIDPAKILSHHPNRHPDLSSAKQAADRVRACILDEGLHLVEHILLRPKVEEENKCLLPISPDLSCKLEWEEDLEHDNPNTLDKKEKLTYYPWADPYSFWVTVVLPSWSKRFQSSEVRLFFKEMLHCEAPAMVGLNILWLSPKQMCKFEAAFHNWLNWQRNADLLCEEKEDAYCNFITCIKELQDDLPCN